MRLSNNNNYYHYDDIDHIVNQDDSVVREYSQGVE